MRLRLTKLGADWTTWPDTAVDGDRIHDDRAWDSTEDAPPKLYSIAPRIPPGRAVSKEGYFHFFNIFVKVWNFLKLIIDALVAIFGIYGVDFPPRGSKMRS